MGFDVAGDEKSYPLSSSDHSMAAGVKLAVVLGVPVTIHAGDGPEKYGTLENVRYSNHLIPRDSNFMDIKILITNLI